MKPSATLDVSHLPSTAFGSRSPLWWGVMGFILIEVTMLAIGMISYFYMRTLASVWPPLRTPAPDLLLPTVNMLLLVSVIPMHWVDRAARRKERRWVQIGLVLCVVLGIGVSVLRGFAFRAVHTQWDSHAYGSVVWTLLGLHTFDFVAEVLETLLLMAFVLTGPMTDHLFLDISDSAPLPGHRVVVVWHSRRSAGVSAQSPTELYARATGLRDGAPPGPPSRARRSPAADGERGCERLAELAAHRTS